MKHNIILSEHSEWKDCEDDIIESARAIIWYPTSPVTITKIDVHDMTDERGTVELTLSNGDTVLYECEPKASPRMPCECVITITIIKDDLSVHNHTLTEGEEDEYYRYGDIAKDLFNYYINFCMK